MANILNTYWLKDIDGGMGPDGVITQTETAIIEFDEVVETTTDAIEYSLFQSGQAHRSSDILFITGDVGANVKEETNGTTWEFTITYSTIGFNVVTPDPINSRPRVSYSKWTYSRVLYNDKQTGDPIVLPNGLPFDPPLMETISSLIIHVTKQENSAHAERIALCGSVNNSSIRIAGTQIPKYCGMFDDYKTEPHRDEQGFLTFLNTFSIKTKFVKDNKGQTQIGFKVETLAASFSQKVDGKLQSIMEEAVVTPAEGDNPAVTELVQVSEPQMIDKDGVVTSTPYYQEHMPFDLISFSQFGLPTSYPVN